MDMMEMAANRMMAQVDDFDDLLAEVDAMNAIPLPAPNPPPHQQQQQQQRPQQAVAATSELGALGGEQQKLQVKLRHVVQLLVDGDRQRSERAPRDCFVTSAAYDGSARKDAAGFRCVLRVLVVRDGHVVCPLFAASTAVVASRVQCALRPPMRAAAAAAASSAEDGAIGQLLSDAQKKGGVVGVVGDWYSLVAAAAGEYTVELELLVPYATQRRTGLQFSVPRAAQSELRFSVPQRDVLIKVDPALFSETTSAGDGEEATTSVRCLMPPTASLSVQWTEKLGEAKEKAKEAVAASVEQLSLCSIGDGALMTTARFNFTVVSGLLSHCIVELDPRVRVLHVEGSKAPAVRNWEVEKLSRPSSFNETESSTAQVLKVWLEYGVENDWELVVVGEMPMDAQAPSIRLPNYQCEPQCEAHQITREKGYVAVEAKTNVEVSENGMPRRINRVDPSELPEAICDRSNPPLLAYKFLSPGYSASISIQKHEDASVLVAAIDSAYYSATVSPSGSVMHRLVLVVRNTQRQFLRVSCGKGSEVWSAFVADEPVRPAADKEGFIMVPLKKSGSPQSRETASSFTVQLTYLATVPPLEHRGQLALEFATCDLPVSHLFVSVFLPDGYHFDEWEGTLHDVAHFSQTPPSYTPPSGSQLQQRQQQAPVPKRMFSSSVSESKPFAEYAGTSVSAGLGANVEQPTTRLESKFEQLIVTPEVRQRVSVTYKRLSKGCFARRRIDTCSRFWCGLSQCLCCCCVKCCCHNAGYNPI